MFSPLNGLRLNSVENYGLDLVDALASNSSCVASLFIRKSVLQVQIFDIDVIRPSSREYSYKVDSPCVQIVQHCIRQSLRRTIYSSSVTSDI